MPLSAGSAINATRSTVSPMPCLLWSLLAAWMISPAAAQLTDNETIASFCRGVATQQLEIYERHDGSSAPGQDAVKQEGIVVVRHDIERYDAYVRNSLTSRGFGVNPLIPQEVFNAALSAVGQTRQRGYAAGKSCATYVWTLAPRFNECVARTPPADDLRKCSSELDAISAEQRDCALIKRWCGPDSPIPP
jgi:hypothetical protein